MTAAIFDTMKVNLEQNGVIFVANGSQVKFEGYLKIYNDSDKNNMLPAMEEGDVVKKSKSQTRTTFYSATSTLFGSYTC